VNENLLEPLERFSDIRIAVVGDFMLDEFLFGEISRVSREAPVLILRYLDSTFRPGGAANTVANVGALGAAVLPVGLLGEDEASEQLLSLWPANVSTEFLVRDRSLEATKKTRILAGSVHSFRQQVVRMDYETPIVLTGQLEARLIARLEAAVAAADAVVISDYSLGTLNGKLIADTIRMTRNRRIPLIVDSRDRPHRYPGATAVTPNISEVEHSLGKRLGTNEEVLDRICPYVRRNWAVEALLVTRGKYGMSLYTDSESLHIPAFGIDDAVDMTGAGDTVAAVYATALASDVSFADAARLANIAGGIVVTKKGTATVPVSELKEAVEHYS